MTRNGTPCRRAAEPSTAALTVLLLAACGLAPLLGNAGCGGGATAERERSTALGSPSSCTVWLEGRRSDLRATVRGSEAFVSNGGRREVRPLVMAADGQMSMGRRDMGVLRNNVADIRGVLSVRFDLDGSLNAYRRQRHIFEFAAASVCSPTQAVLGGSALLIVIAASQ
jgi:hypothetical protein